MGSGRNGDRGIRLLIVDDTDHVRLMLVEMLSADGFDVVAHTGDPRAAAALCVEQDPDIVTMDLRMPGQDGLETTRRVRAHRPAQPVVLYTAYLDDEVERAAHEAGVTLCLGKVAGLPVLQRELGRLAREITEG